MLVLMAFNSEFSCRRASTTSLVASALLLIRSAATLFEDEGTGSFLNRDRSQRGILAATGIAVPEEIELYCCCGFTANSEVDRIYEEGMKVWLLLEESFAQSVQSGVFGHKVT